MSARVCMRVAAQVAVEQLFTAEPRLCRVAREPRESSAHALCVSPLLLR